MSGSDRTTFVRVNRITRTGRAGAYMPKFAPKPQRDAAAGGETKARVDDGENLTKAMTRVLAVEALGADAVLFAERLRAKGWSVTGIARHLAREETVIAALFGVSAGAVSAPEAPT